MARKRPRCVESNNDSADSTERQDNKGPCPHLGKGIDIGSVKKAWKKKEEISCQLCKKRNNASKKETSTTENDLWICMKCGHVGCGHSQHNHGQEHFQIAHSDCHAVVALMDTWTVRCLTCKTDINLDVYVKALDALEYLKKNYGVFKEEKQEVEVVTVPAAAEEKHSKLPIPIQEPKKNVTPSHINHHVLPVLGLENIGNTCYMNAVLQALAQTPGFIAQLELITQNSGQFILPGGDNLISNEYGGYLPSLEGKLGETGQLTKAVMKLLRRVKDGHHLRKTGVINENPGDVLRIMKKFSNTFYVGEQHDSHELLRLLLEGLKTEELKRYQRGILNSLGICAPGKEFTAKERDQFIAYKKQALQKDLVVDKIFGGSLVSILKCLECGVVTTNFENFMDISLPVESEKPKTFQSEIIVNTDEGRPSKHQLKKERKLSRRGRKKNKGGKNLMEPHSPPVDNNKNRSSSESATDSEADVEDNLDSETTMNSTLGDSNKSQSESSSAVESSSRYKADESNLESSVNDSQTEIPELITPPNEMVRASTPEVGAIVSTFNPDQSMVQSPESSTMTHGCSPEPSILEDFGSCEGGRGSPASSIEQADWDDENNSRVDGLVKGIRKVFQESGTPPEPFEFSEEDNVKEGLWVDTIKEDVTSSQQDIFSSGIDIGESIENKKTGKPCNNLDSDKNVKVEVEDFYDTQCFMKPGESDRIYNDLDSNKKTEGDVSMNSSSNKKTEGDVSMNSSTITEMNTVESDNIVWGITLAPQPELDKNIYSVLHGLNQYFSEEVLCGANKIGCLECTKLKSGQEPKPNTKLVQANALKQLLFFKLPKILTLHLKRFEVVRSRMCKITRKVIFPSELDISAYTSNRTMITQVDNLTRYELYAVVEHLGHMTSGHYVAYVKVDTEDQGEKNSYMEEQKENLSAETLCEEEKNRKNNSCQIQEEKSSVKWYLISDTHVRQVTYKVVSNAEAYLLFYKQLS